MARLNEPPAPVESVDALKRRFVRQNRDLARCNSNQSVKIRALETDLSHQLSENASLRVRIVHLENEINDLRTVDVRNSLAAFKKKLVSQFDGILAELTEVEKKPRRRKSQAPSATSPKRSPQRREWRNSSTLSEVLASQGGTMPTIVEGKSFPRRTVEASEIQQLIDSDSPDMAPPRTYYDNEGAEPEQKVAEPTVAEEAPAQPMSAVEIRRRRRDSRVHERSDDENTANTIKAGAKRKLSFSEAQRMEDMQTSPRKVLGEKAVNTDPVVSPQKPVRASKEQIKAAPVKPVRPVSKDATTTAAKTSRPAANVSSTAARTRPAPAATSTSSKPIDARPAARSATQNVPSRPSSAQDDRPKSPLEPTTKHERQIEEPADDANIKPEPKTPGLILDDLLSPPSTSVADQSEANRPGTPPPSNMGAHATTSADPHAVGNGRSSLRRRGAAVSYAEPKLNVKMRRPGKELADAVAGKHRRSESDDGVIKLEQVLILPDSHGKKEKDLAADDDIDGPDERTRAPKSPLAARQQQQQQQQQQRSISAPALPTSKMPAARSALDIFEADVPDEPAAALSKASRLATRATDQELDKDLPALPAVLETGGGGAGRAGASRRQTVGLPEDAGAREVRVRSRRLSSVASGAAAVSAAAAPSGSGDEGPARRSGGATRALDRRRSMML